MTQRAVCSFFSMRSLICVRLFRPRLNRIFQANRLKLPRANCLKPSLNSRRFDQLVEFVINMLNEHVRTFSHPPSPWLIGIFLVSSCAGVLGQKRTSLFNHLLHYRLIFRQFLGPDMPKAQLPEVTLGTLSNRTRSRGRGSQTIETHLASILFE